MTKWIEITNHQLYGNAEEPLPEGENPDEVVQWQLILGDRLRYTVPLVIRIHSYPNPIIPEKSYFQVSINGQYRVDSRIGGTLDDAKRHAIVSAKSAIDALRETIREYEEMMDSHPEE